MKNFLPSFGSTEQNQSTSGQSSNEDAPWIFVTIARVYSTFAGIVAAVCSASGLLLNIASLYSIIGYTILGVESLLIILFEAPFMLSFINIRIPAFLTERKSLWTKAIIYLSFAIIPFYLASGFAVSLGSALIFFSSTFYLVLALGKKASADEMRAKAVNENPTSILVNNEVLPDSSSSRPFYKNNTAQDKNLNFTNPPPINNPTGSMVY